MVLNRNSQESRLPRPELAFQAEDNVAGARPLMEFLDNPELRAPTPREIERDTLFYSATTGANPDEVRSAVENGMTDLIPVEQSVMDLWSNNLNTMLEQEENPDQALSEIIQQMSEVDMLGRFLPDSMVAAVESGVAGSREMAVDRIGRILLTGERVSERVEQMRGPVTTTLDFAEILVDPLDIVHQREYTRLVNEYEQLLAPDVSVEEFEEGLERILDEASDAGFLSNENRFMFGGFLDTLTHGIYSSEQDFNELLGWLDLGVTGALEAGPLAMRGRAAFRQTTTLAGAAGAAGVGQTVMRIPGNALDAARDNLSALGIMRPSERTDEIIQEQLTRAIIDGEREGIELGMHTAPSAATPELVRGGFLTAPSATALRNFELQAESLQMLREYSRASGRVFDEDTIQQFAEQFADDRLAFLRDSGQTNVIDFEVGVDDFNNLFGYDIIGTSRGGYYKTERTASAAAREGDEIILMGEGQYAIGRRVNISSNDFSFLRDLGYSADIEGYMLFRATDPEQLGDGFWARWGSPGAQADMTTSSHIFSAGSVAQRAMHEISRQSKRITRGLSHRHQSEVYSVFDELASMPQREAFSRSEFETWFTNQFNREPTEGQTALYLLEQQRLDAELFVNANTLYTRAVDRNAQVFMSSDDVDYVVTPVNRESIRDDAQVYVDGLGVRRVNELEEEFRIFRNESLTDLPGEVRYIASQSPSTRAVYHSDFLVRNSGGHRGYILNQMQFLVKQRSTRRFADGEEQALPPRTLLGARTSEEARAAVRDMDSIMDEAHALLPPTQRMSSDEYLDTLLSLEDSSSLNRVIRQNNGWNPEITNVEELVDFSRQRGLDLRERFRVVGEGDTMDEFLEGLSDSIWVNRSQTHKDDAWMTVTRGGRGSLPLPRYGGGTVGQRPVADVMKGSYASTINRVTEAAYATRAGQGAIKAAIDSGVMKRDAFSEIANLPLRTQIERIARNPGEYIDVSGARGGKANVGPRLQLDIERLSFRLQRDSFVSRKWRSITRSLANALYNKRVLRGLMDKMDRWSSDPLSAMRGLTFDAKLGMFNPVQLLMQSMQVVNIVGIAGNRGVRGFGLYLPVRWALSNGDPAVIRRIGEQISGVSGLSADEFVNMVEMFRRSGRNIVDNNLAEMAPAEDVASNFVGGGFNASGVRRNVGQTVRNTREAGRVFFKEGDLVARITGFNTAYLRYMDEVGAPKGVDDIEANRFIQAEEQRLTQYMTSESRQAYEQLPFMQFMSYQLRINEALFAGTFGGTSKRVLTNAERARLAVVHFAMFGAKFTTPTAFLVDYINSNTSIGSEADERLVRLWQRGLLDSLLSWSTGIETAASRRFSSSGGMYNILQTLAEDNVLAVFAGPSGEFGAQLAQSSWATLVEGIRAIQTGDFTATEDEIIDLIRTVSSGNQTFNAYYAWRFGDYLSRNFGAVTSDLSKREAIYLAFGLPLEEVDVMYSYMGQRRLQTLILDNTAQQVNELYDRYFQAFSRDDNEAALSYSRQIALLLNSLEPWEREQVERNVFTDTRTLTDSFMIEMLRRDVTARELIE